MDRLALVHTKEFEFLFIFELTDLLCFLCRIQMENVENHVPLDRNRNQYKQHS